MRKQQREKTIDLKTSFSGMFVILLSIICFLVIMELIVIAVRFFAG